MQSLSKLIGIFAVALAVPVSPLMAASVVPAVGSEAAAPMRAIPVQTYQWRYYEGPRGGVYVYSPKGLGRQLVAEATQSMLEGDTDKAMEIASDLLKYRSIEAVDVANAHNILCVGHTRQLQFQKALEACDRAIAIIGNNWRFYNNRGLALMKLGNLDAAIGDYQKALSLEADAPQVRTNLNLANELKRKQGLNGTPPGPRS